MVDFDAKGCFYELLGAFCLTWIRIASITDLNEVLLLGYAFFMWSGYAISGSHYNPVVTIVNMIEKKVDAKKGGLYILFQFLGGMLAVLLQVMFWNWRNKDSKVKYGWRVYAIDHNYGRITGLLIELIASLFFGFFYTFFFQENKVSKAVGGFGVAAAYTAFAYAIKSNTGGALNPFLYICPHIFLGFNLWHLLDYTVGPLGGFIAGYFLYKLVFDKGSDDGGDAAKGINA